MSDEKIIFKEETTKAVCHIILDVQDEFLQMRKDGDISFEEWSILSKETYESYDRIRKHFMHQ